MLSLLLARVTGCSTPSTSRTWSGPSTPVPVSTQPWTPPVPSATPGVAVRTSRYLIYTTIEDERLRAATAQVMEGAYEQYRTLAPGVAPSDRPLECYVFGQRPQWAAFTESRTGTDAAIYLQITRGGYTVGDWFVAYDIGGGATYSVAAHEGWHQYVARHFKGRLPPFLEEGIACLFETVRMDGNPHVGGQLPRWNWAVNRTRSAGLREAVERGNLWPLGQLITLHAGEVVNLPRERIDAFYAQNWAFARFLWDADGGHYRPMFRRLLEETAAGTLHDPTGTLRAATRNWNPAAARPILEHYLGQDLSEIERAYETYIGQIVAAEAARDRWAAVRE
jgi:hypothetical protein